MRASVASLSLRGLLLSLLSLVLVALGDVLNQPLRTVPADPLRFRAYNLIQYYVTYQDHGFVRRGLPGSLVALLSPDPSHLTLYAASAAVVACLVLLYWFFVTSSLATRGTPRSRTLLALVFLVSPATFWQVGFDMGRYDAVNVILLLASLLLIERKRFVVAGGLMAVSVLVHEASFFMFLPVALAAAMGKSRPGLPGRSKEEGPDDVDNVPLLAVALPALAALAAVMLLGDYEPGREALEAALARTHSPPGEHCALCVWTRGLGHNVRIVARELGEPDVVPGLMAALAYFGVFCQFYFRFHALNGLRRDALTWSPFAVALLFVVGVDFERWLAAAVTSMTIVMCYKMRGRRMETIEGVVPSRSNVLPALLLVSGVLGPLGVSRAFPLIVKLWKLVF
jgi:hypothetical protein